MESKSILFIVITSLCLLILYACVVEEQIEVPKEISISEDIIIEPIGSVEPTPYSEEQEVEEAMATIKEEFKADREVTILTLRGRFEPRNIVLNLGDVVFWKNEDERVHKIACYIDDETGMSKRIIITPQLKTGNVYAHKFEDPGNYECRDAVFGYWGNITVVKQSAITGLVVYSSVREYTLDNPLEITLVGIILTLFGVYGLQIWKIKNQKK